MTTEAAADAGRSGRGFDGFAPETLESAGRTFTVRRATEADVPAIVALLRDDVLGAAREADADEITSGAAQISAESAARTEDADPYARAFALIAADPNQLLIAVTEDTNRTRPQNTDGGVDDEGAVDENGGVVDDNGGVNADGADAAGSDSQSADAAIVGTLQLSLLPSLSRRGTLRMQIEAVRIGAAAQGIGLGTTVFEWAHDCGRRFGAGLVQLTTDKSRTGAQRFYDRLGYVASHEGMKLPLD